MILQTKFNIDDLVKFSNGIYEPIGYVKEIILKNDLRIHYFIKVDEDEYYKVDESDLTLL